MVNYSKWDRMTFGDSPEATAVTSRGGRLLDALAGMAPQGTEDEIDASVVEDGGGVNTTKPVIKPKASSSDTDGAGTGASASPQVAQMSPQERWEMANRLRSEATKEFMAGNREKSRELYERAGGFVDEKGAAAFAGDEKNQEMWEMSPKQRLEKASELKEEGTKEFAAGNHAAAADIYKEAAGFVDSLQNDAEKDLFVRCYVNAAICHVKAEDWPWVIYCCNKALYEVPEEAKTNVKALYRRGLAKMRTGDLRGARADLTVAYRIDSKDRAVIEAIQELKAKSLEDAKKRRKEKTVRAERKKKAQLEKIREIDACGDHEEASAMEASSLPIDISVDDVLEAGSDGAFDASDQAPLASESTGDEEEGEEEDPIDVSIAEDGGGVNTRAIAEAGSDREKKEKQPWEMSSAERRERARELRAERTNEFRAGNQSRSKELYRKAAAFVGEKNKHMWELTPEERLAKASELKERGAEDFAAGDHADAADYYKRAAGFVDSLQSDDEKNMFVKCYVNAATCHVRMKGWHQVISCCDEVFKKVPAEIETNVKALYRRGLARTHTGELEGAKADLMAAHKIDSKNRDVRAAIQELEKKRKEATEKGKARFGRMFGGNKAGAYDGKEGASGSVIAEREAKRFGSAQEYLDSLLEKQ